jgi:hypothetical protein
VRIRPTPRDKIHARGIILLELLQVATFSSIGISNGTLRVSLGGTRSSGEALLLEVFGLLSGGSGSHDGMWVIQVKVVKACTGTMMKTQNAKVMIRKKRC